MKLAIFSANYNPKGELDAFRTGFLNQLEKMGIDVLFIEANTYVHDLTGRRFVKRSDKIMLEGLKKFNPNGVVFINACGRVPLIQDYLVKNKISSISWFWDHPAFLSLNLIEPSLYHQYAVANEVFKIWLNNYFKNDSIVIHDISFPMLSHPQQREGKLTIDEYLKRNDHILFMGTLWKSCFDDIIDQALIASKCHVEEKAKVIGSIDSLLQSANLGKCDFAGVPHEAIKYIMQHYKDPAVFINLANNHLSSLERQEIITILSKSKNKIKLYGSPVKDWLEFIYNNRLENSRLIYDKTYVSSHAELINICENSKIGLNIFHKQNQGGGTNFRFNDYIVSRTPILSNKNAICEKIFKDKEAAFYFNDKNDLLDVCDVILKNPDLAVKCVNNAYEIGTDLFNMPRIVNDLLKLLSLEDLYKTNINQGLVDYQTKRCNINQGSVDYQTKRCNTIKFYRNKSCKSTEVTIVGDCISNDDSSIEIKLHRFFRASVRVPFSFYYHNDAKKGVSFCSKVKLPMGYNKLSIYKTKAKQKKLLAKKHFLFFK